MTGRHCVTMCPCIDCALIRKEATLAHGYRLIDGVAEPKHYNCAGCDAMVARRNARKVRGDNA